MNELDAHSRQILACLGDASRFRLVHSLLQREQCVSELAASVGLSQSCTTRHLQYLEREGLVRGLRQGKRVMFRLRSDMPRVRELLAWVTAASHGAVRGRVSGADVHLERPVPTADGGPQIAGAGPGQSEQPVRQARGDRSAHADPTHRPVGGGACEGAGRAEKPSGGKRFRSTPVANQPPSGGRNWCATQPDLRHGEDPPPTSGVLGRTSGSDASGLSGVADPARGGQNLQPPDEPVGGKPDTPASVSTSPAIGAGEMEDWLL